MRWSTLMLRRRTCHTLSFQQIFLKYVQILSLLLLFIIDVFHWFFEIKFPAFSNSASFPSFLSICVCGRHRNLRFILCVRPCQINGENVIFRLARLVMMRVKRCTRCRGQLGKSVLKFGNQKQKDISMEIGRASNCEKLRFYLWFPS